MNTFRYPNITGTTDAAQLRQLKSYLYQLVDQLNNTPTDSGSLHTSPQAGVAISSPNMGENFATLKSLIIKSADIVSAYTDKIGKNLSGVYVAQSDFGTYSRRTEASLAANATAIDQCYTHLEELVTDLEHQRQETRGYIRTGLLYYAGAEDTLPEGTPVYGVEVGQQNNGDFRRFGRFTAYGMTFYDENGDPAAQITQGRLKIPHAVVQLQFTEGGFTDEILPNGTIITRWTGM